MGTMKAVRIHSYGEPDVLVYEEAPKPEPGEGEVLVRVYATFFGHHLIPKCAGDTWLVGCTIPCP